MDNNILFEYSWGPAFSKYGDEHYKITIYDNGMYFLQHRILGSKEYEIEEARQLTEQCLCILKDMLLFYKEELKKVPHSLINGSCDGEYQQFKFMNKEIIGWNLKHKNTEEVFTRNPNYYKDYEFNMLCENYVIDVYRELRKLLDDLLPEL